MMTKQIRSKHVEQTKNCGIKIYYKNCASRWLLTYYWPVVPEGNIPKNNILSEIGRHWIEKHLLVS